MIDRFSEAYFKSLDGKMPISREEELALFKRIRKGDRRARNKLIESNLRFVVKIAGEYAAAAHELGIPYFDVIGEGNLGLVTAIDKFDETKGYKFITYAVWWIRRNIRDILFQYDRLIRLPTNRIESLSKLRKRARDEEASLSEIITKEGSPLDVSALYAENPFRLDAPFDEDETSNLYNSLASNNSNPEEETTEIIFNKKIGDLVNALNNREREMCWNKYSKTRQVKTLVMILMFSSLINEYTKAN